MGLINSITEFLAKLFQWWFLVMPWEQAIFIRKGSKVKLLGAGLYFKIPFIDSIYIQTTRTRMVDVPVQTISTKDGQTITIKSVIGYSIQDVMKLYNTLYHPEMTLVSMAMGFIGEFIRKNDAVDVTPQSAEEFVVSKIDPSSFGLTGMTIKITTFAAVRTFRLIQDNSGLYESLNMNPQK